MQPNKIAYKEINIFPKNGIYKKKLKMIIEEKNLVINVGITKAFSKILFDINNSNITQYFDKYTSINYNDNTSPISRIYIDSNFYVNYFIYIDNQHYVAQCQPLLNQNKIDNFLSVNCQLVDK